MAKKILAFQGSPRSSGNSSHLMEHFLEGTSDSGAGCEIIKPMEIKVGPCTGCLRCNVLKRCSLEGDDWSELSKKILESDILVFASPVYFHHVPGPLKNIIDRFRSFTHVRITESGLVHTPWQDWDKDFVLLLTMGSPDPSEADHIIELFEFLTSVLSSDNRLHVISGTRLAVSRQILRTENELKSLYGKMNISSGLATEDYNQNRRILKDCRDLGIQLTGQHSEKK